MISQDGPEKIDATLEGEESGIIERFLEIVLESNPDFLFAPEADDFVLPYLRTRANELGIDLMLGREPPREISSKVRKLGLYICPGRVCLDFSNYGYTFNDDGWGIAGLEERSQFACLPPSIAGRWTANRVNDSRICFELIRRGHVIPRNRGARTSLRQETVLFGSRFLGSTRKNLERFITPPHIDDLLLSKNNRETIS